MNSDEGVIIIDNDLGQVVARAKYKDYVFDEVLPDEVRTWNPEQFKKYFVDIVAPRLRKAILLVKDPEPPPIPITRRRIARYT